MADDVAMAEARTEDQSMLEDGSPVESSSENRLVSDEEPGVAPSAQSTHSHLEEEAEVRAMTDVNPSRHEFVKDIPITQIEVRVVPLDGAEAEAYDVYDIDISIEEVLRRVRTNDGHVYQVRIGSGQLDEISEQDLEGLPGGPQALEAFTSHRSREETASTDGTSGSMRHSSRLEAQKRKRSTHATQPVFVDSSDEGSEGSSIRKRKRLSTRQSARTTRHGYRESDSDDVFAKGTHGLRPRRRLTRSSTELSSEASQSDNFLSAFYHEKPVKKPGRPPGKSKIHTGPSRRSDRSGKHRHSMRERYEEDISEVEASKNGKPRAFGAKETFSKLPANDEFRRAHLETCMSCGSTSENEEKGPLVFCQGCTDCYHSSCLGPRQNREHLVTKVGNDDFALQCRRCVDAAVKKESTAPLFSRCQECKVPGTSTPPFRIRKSPKEEQKDREDNKGVDPTTVVEPTLLNNVKNLLFRCASCHRAWHLHHLPAREESLFETEDGDEIASRRWEEYRHDFSCQDCLAVPTSLGGIIAWRPKELDSYVVDTSPESVGEDEKEYLVKWSDKSYLESRWVPGAWLWSMAHRSMLLAFFRRNGGRIPPVMRTEDAIPEEYLRMDIIFKVKYNNIVSDRIEEVDLARIREVEEVLAKFRGLGYEDVVWEKPPDPVQHPERYQDFKSAYEDWVRSGYIHLPAASTLRANLRRVRALPFEEKVLLKEQPKALEGGKLMDYQLDGLNWLYYQWHHGQNAILADEMGLGKTIQVIGFLSTLQEKHHCWPFLIVVPNSTCANWKREIKRWAPSLRVVTFFGSSRAMELTEKYELFRGSKKDLSCHVVVTSYEAAQSNHCLAVLRRVYWQAMVVDEGQRLKNDAGLLYQALSALRSPFKLLLTGTPLQNRQRELFNLLQFLDPTKNAKALEEQYAELDKEKIGELHTMLRPFFLRRTKAQVLDFLPTMAQIIVPVSMSSLQKELYKSILAKNTELLKSVFSSDGKAPAKGGLRNILMQLRKCLCHPFVYNLEIEERTHEAALSHQRLVEASSKLQLLEIMLPKLHARGHRVLIFSQFLDMLTIMEDFLQDLGLEYNRLDGTMGSLQKQKCIDSFNAEGSAIFAFLLSTRAGGVGINLASADTVIILDPDFNPHQDIQAISRAHRIGQKKKVLVFQLMTRASAEEKIMQIGKRKMALDHALIDSMEAEEEQADDVEAVLRFGAEALFKDDGSADVRYDTASVENLLDRSQVEDTKTDKDTSVESQFSFARVWQNDSSTMVEDIGGSEGEQATSAGVWAEILAERARRVETEAARKSEMLGRGKRRRKNVYYQSDAAAASDGEGNLLGDEHDTDFQAGAESVDDNISAQSGEARAEASELRAEMPLPPEKAAGAGTKPKPSARKVGGIAAAFPAPAGRETPAKYQASLFKRVSVERTLPWPAVDGAAMGRVLAVCAACGEMHPTGECPLKLAGLERCGLCGMAHFGHMRVCPHLNSETQVRLMLQALDSSPEPRDLVEKARRQLTSLKGNLVQLKKKRNAAAQGGPPPSPFGPAQSQFALPRSVPGNQPVLSTSGQHGPSSTGQHGPNSSGPHGPSSSGQHGPSSSAQHHAYAPPYTGAGLPQSQPQPQPQWQMQSLPYPGRPSSVPNTGQPTANGPPPRQPGLPPRHSGPAPPHGAPLGPHLVWGGPPPPDQAPPFYRPHSTAGHAPYWPLGPWQGQRQGQGQGAPPGSGGQR